MRPIDWDYFSVGGGGKGVFTTFDCGCTHTLVSFKRGTGYLIEDQAWVAQCEAHQADPLRQGGEVGS